MTNKKVPIFGLILVILGIIFILNTLDILFFSFGDFIRFALPLFFIGLGVWLIIRKKREEHLFHSEMHFHQQTRPPGSPGFPPRDEVHPGSAANFTPPPPPPAGGKSDFGRERVSAAPEMEPGRLKYSKTIGDLYIDCNGTRLQNIVVSMGVGDTEIKLHGGILDPGLNRMIITGFVGDIRIMVPADMPVFVHSSCLIGDIQLFSNTTSGFSNDLDGQTANYNTSENKLYIAISHFIGDIRVFKV
ncbi:MAG: cell wall-active antibiotics response protein LiaF [candidate division Zixibacteria bacterium]|nr:cell wall-active antibiotics response protein LiaF [candidate division Zixibacteria bacterium]MDD5427384.1 cell wall-active antibiotics response protein LiaF [candidate division Zixibacteria bacterium]